MIHVGPDDWVLALWFVGGGPDGTDWLGGVVRPPEGPWRIAYRFRYQDGTPEQWLQASAPRDKAESEIIAMMNEMMHVVATLYEAHANYIPVRGDIDAMLEAMKASGCMKIKITERDLE